MPCLPSTATVQGYFGQMRTTTVASVTLCMSARCWWSPDLHVHAASRDNTRKRANAALLGLHPWVGFSAMSCPERQDETSHMSGDHEDAHRAVPPQTGVALRTSPQTWSENRSLISSVNTAKRQPVGWWQYVRPHPAQSQGVSSMARWNLIRPLYHIETYDLQKARTWLMLAVTAY